MVKPASEPTSPGNLEKILRILEDAIPRLRSMGVTYLQAGDVALNLAELPPPEPPKSDRELEDELGDFLDPAKFRRAGADGEDAS